MKTAVEAPKLVEEIEKLEIEYETKVDEKVSEVKEEIVDKVSVYQTMLSSAKENELPNRENLKK